MRNCISVLLRPPGPRGKDQKHPSQAKGAKTFRPPADSKFSRIRKVGLVLCIGLVFPFYSFAQNPLSVHTYDTALTSNGFGMYNINVPKFSPDSGTLVAVNLIATVSSQYGFTLTNSDNNSSTYTLTLGQYDQISGSALASDYSNVYAKQINSYPLNSGQVLSQPPFAFLNNHVSNDSITGNVAPFLGSGAVALKYLSFTYTDLGTINNATYSFSANINNAIHFTVKYYFSGGGNVVLPTTLTRFSADLMAPHIAGLSWAAVNETANRLYDIQRSRDGQNFTTVNSITAQGDASGADYSYTDQLADSIAGNIFYRLEIHDQDKVTYSDIKEVTVAASLVIPQATGLRVYPNPATSYINIQTGVAPGDWQVDLITANGAVVQRSQAFHSSTIYVPFRARLSAGTYFVRLTGLNGQQPILAPVVVVPDN